jgi:hypothetical protein
MEEVFSFGQGFAGIKQAVIKEWNTMICTKFYPGGLALVAAASDHFMELSLSGCLVPTI